METERIALSQRERDRLRVLHEVKQKEITQIEAARRLKISDSAEFAGVRRRDLRRCSGREANPGENRTRRRFS